MTHRLGWTLMAIACSALGLAHAGTIQSVSDSPPAVAAEPPVASHAARTRPQSWWLGFEDGTMIDLIDAARRHSASVPVVRPLNAAPSEVRVSIAYVALRVETLSLSYIENARSAVLRQSDLAIADKALHDDFTQELARRLANANAAIQRGKKRQDEQLAFLATECGMSKEALSEVVARSLENRVVPQFGAPVPRTLSMALLAERTDVYLAAAVNGIDPARALKGIIGETDEPDAAPDETETAANGGALYTAAVAQAHREVSEALLRLQKQSEVTNTAYEHMLNSKDEFEASKARRDRGEMSEIQLMENFQNLLLDLYTLAVGNGDLAVAWISLMNSLGSETPIYHRGTTPKSAWQQGFPSKVSASTPAEQ